MTNEDLFDFLKEHLKIQVEDDSTPTTCGGEVQGTLGVKVTLFIKNLLSDEWEKINSDRCDLW